MKSCNARILTERGIEGKLDGDRSQIRRELKSPRNWVNNNVSIRAVALNFYSLVCRVRSAPRLIGINTTIASLSSEIFVALSALRTSKKSFGYIPLSDSHWGTLGTLITAWCGNFLARVFAVCRCLLHGVGGHGGWGPRGSTRRWHRGRADTRIPGGTCRKVTELAGEVAEFLIIVFIIICFKLMVVAVCASWKK